MLDTSDPQDLDPYDYSKDNPVTGSDPSGLFQDNGNGQPAPCGSYTGGTATVCTAGGSGQYGGGSGSSPGGGGSSGNSGGGGGYGNTYVPITPHFLVQPSNPHYAKMVKGYQSYLSMMGIGRPTTITQETALWYEVCVVNGRGNTCPSMLSVMLNNMFRSIGANMEAAQSLHSDTIFLAGDNLGGYGAVEARASDIVSLYKAPRKGLTESTVNQGFRQEDYPGPYTDENGEYHDGKAYFASGEGGLATATRYSGRENYDGTVVRIDILRSDFEQNVDPDDVDEYDPEATLVTIPNTSFDWLNQYDRLVVLGGDGDGGGDGGGGGE